MKAARGLVTVLVTVASNIDLQAFSPISVEQSVVGAKESVVGRFERQVDAHPHQDAVRLTLAGGGAVTSFCQLDAWANAIAWKLTALRGSKSEPVSLHVSAPDLMLAAALGVLKAGKFYAAVNPTHPKAHLDRVLTELGPALALCDRGSEIASYHGVAALQVEEIIADGRTSERPSLCLDEGRLAYVLYTSGSTGRPRGVAHSRRDMLHNLTRHRPLGVCEADCVSLISADGFVSSISNPYIALTGGATLAPYSFRDEGVEGMLGWLEDTCVTVLYMFPSFLRQVAALENDRVHQPLRLAYLGGEPVLASDLAMARRMFPGAHLSIGLNSSETGLTCLHSISPGSPLPHPVPVGRPVLDVRVSILDDLGRPLPPESPGEIEVDSDYVKPMLWRVGGSLQGDGSHAELLVGGAPAFRTGDRGRIDSDGVVYHLGRSDGMVKIRGFRVEIAEVEGALAALPGVSEVAVSTSHDNLGACELVAHIVPAGNTVDGLDIRRDLLAKLPPAMIPARILNVESLPRTPNGKLDRKALAKPPGLEVADTLEQQIARIWCAVIELDQVGVDDDFFALGGTSIDAVYVIAQMRHALDMRIPLRVLFRTPTVRALAQAAIAIEHGGPHIRSRRQSQITMGRVAGNGTR